MVFLWSSLVFPRPSKFFWILLITYVKTIILIKFFAQLKFFWWEPHHYFILFFGISQDKSFATYDLVLLMILFFHRAVLKMIGLWKDNSEFVFHEGTFELDRCDTKSKALIKYLLKNEPRISPQEDGVASSEIKTESNRSSDLLVDDTKSITVLYRHEYRRNEEHELIEAILKDRSEIVKAREEIFRDNNGRLALKLRQEEFKLRIRPINEHDYKTQYPIQRIIVVENMIEEPIDFYPLGVLMSFQKYASHTSNFIGNLFKRLQNPRKPEDCYTSMFFFEFVNFFVLVFGFSTFAVRF